MDPKDALIIYNALSPEALRVAEELATRLQNQPILRALPTAKARCLPAAHRSW